MVELENSDKKLIEGCVNLLRENIDGWSYNSTWEVNNVWPSETPEEVNEEFPRAIVDVTSSDDVELDINSEVTLTEVVLKVVVFAEGSGNLHTLKEKVRNELKNNSEDYVGDWSYREIDGTGPTLEVGETEGRLRYSRAIDAVFETIKN